MKWREFLRPTGTKMGVCVLVWLAYPLGIVSWSIILYGLQVLLPSPLCPAEKALGYFLYNMKYDAIIFLPLYLVSCLVVTRVSKRSLLWVIGLLIILSIFGLSVVMSDSLRYVGGC